MQCPSRISWLRTLLLIFSRIVVVLLFFKLSKTLPHSSLRTLVNIGGWIGFSALMGVWNHLILVIKKETKFWQIQNESVVESIDALKISFISDLIALGFGIFFVILGYAFKLNTREDAETLLGLIVFSVLVIWFFSIPLLYEKALVKRKLKGKVKPKTKFDKK